MLALKNKNILLAISGSVAAYKAIDTIKSLQEKGANIKIALTKDGAKFITAVSLQLYTDYKVYDNLWGKQKNSSIIHIELARWADIILIAPASANIIAKLAVGICDDLITAVVLASKAQLFIAPAMNTTMYNKKIVLDNIRKLKQAGAYIIEPEIGDLACGDYGIGHIANFDTITNKIIENTLFKKKNNKLAGVNVLISLGATIEDIDPVRFLSNRSSGKMGLALAEVCYEMGAKVTIISANIEVPQQKFQTILVRNVDELLKQTTKHINNNNLFISAVAVTDYKVKIKHKKKIKKTDDTLNLELTPTTDVLKTLTQIKKNTFCVGFAAETDNIIENAKKKLHKKGCDILIANDVSKNDIGFNTKDNEVYILDKNEVIYLKKNSKKNIAKLIIKHIFNSPNFNKTL